MERWSTTMVASIRVSGKEISSWSQLKTRCSMTKIVNCFSLPPSSTRTHNLRSFPMLPLPTPNSTTVNTSPTTSLSQETCLSPCHCTTNPKDLPSSSQPLATTVSATSPNPPQGVRCAQEVVKWCLVSAAKAVFRRRCQWGQ